MLGISLCRTSRCLSNAFNIIRLSFHSEIVQLFIFIQRTGAKNSRNSAGKRKRKSHVAVDVIIIIVVIIPRENLFPYFTAELRLYNSARERERNGENSVPQVHLLEVQRSLNFTQKSPDSLVSIFTFFLSLF